MASIYDHPEIYDLEHSGPQPDIDFFIALARETRPKRILDLACGDGRITRPLAKAAATWQGSVHGIDSCPKMLQAAREKPSDTVISYEEQDVCHLKTDQPFDLAVCACASLSHLLDTGDQLSAWRSIYRTLNPGGRFVIAEIAPDYPLLSESMTLPAHSIMRLDSDFQTESERLLRYRSARYHAHQQRMKVHYIYDHFTSDDNYRRHVNDYEAHVYFPAELRLLFLATGFQVDAEWGDYQRTPLSHDSRFLIFSGLRPHSPGSE